MKLLLILLLLGLFAVSYSKDYYRILQIKPSATQAEIKKAFRYLARKYHPDKNKSPESQRRFTDLQEAYDVLKSPSTRRKYDYSRNERAIPNRQTVPHPRHGFRDSAASVRPLKDSFESMFDDFMDFGSSGFFSKVGGMPDPFGMDELFNFGFGDMKFGSRMRSSSSMSCTTVTSNVGGVQTTVTKCS